MARAGFRPATPVPRRRPPRLVTAWLAVLLLAAGLTVAASFAPTPSAQAAATPVARLVQVLGKFDKFYANASAGNASDSEFRLDFVMEVPAGAVKPDGQGLSLRYEYNGSYTGTLGAGVRADNQPCAGCFWLTAGGLITTPNLAQGDINQQYRIVRIDHFGAVDRVTVSMQGDLGGRFDAATSAPDGGPYSLPVTMQAAVTVGGATQYFSYQYHTTVFDAGGLTWTPAQTGRKAVAVVGWDYIFGINGYNVGVNAQTPWGYVIDGASPVVPPERMFVRFLSPLANNSQAKAAGVCTSVTSFYYQWVRNDGTPADGLTPVPVSLPITPTNDGSAGSSPVFGTTTVDLGAGAGIDFSPEGPGYYRLVAWPMAVNPTLADPTACSDYAYYKDSVGDLASPNAFTVGSVFFTGGSVAAKLEKRFEANPMPYTGTTDALFTLDSADTRISGVGFADKLPADLYYTGAVDEDSCGYLSQMITPEQLADLSDPEVLAHAEPGPVLRFADTDGDGLADTMKVQGGVAYNIQTGEGQVIGAAIPRGQTCRIKAQVKATSAITGTSLCANNRSGQTNDASNVPYNSLTTVLGFEEATATAFGDCLDITAQADLFVTETSANAQAGATVALTTSVASAAASPSPVDSAQVTITAPAGTTLAAVDPACTLSSNATAATCTTGRLAPGESQTLAYSVVVPATAQPGALTGSVAVVHPYETDPSNDSQPITLTVVEPAPAFDPGHSTLTARPTAGTTPVFAGQSWTVELTARDAAGQAAAGLTDVTFATDPAVTLGPVAETAPGVYQASAVATTAGSYPVGASAGGVTADQRPQLVFTAGPTVDPTRSQLSVAPATQTVGAPVQAMIVAQDSFGNPVDWLKAADLAVAGTTADPAGAPAIAATPGTFNDNGAAEGRYSLELTSTQAASFTVAATVLGVALDQRPVVTFVAGPACVAHCVVAEPGTAAELTKNGALADGTDQDRAEVRVVDTYGNPVAGATVVATRTGESLEPASQSVTTGADGLAQLAWTATTPGTFTAVIIVDGLSGFPGAVQNQIKFQSDAVDPAHSALEITPASPITAGQSYTATVTAKDAQGEPVGGAVVSFSITPTGFAPGQPAEPADLSGATCTTRGEEPNRGTCQITVRATAAGTYDFRATVPGAGGAAADLTGGTTASPARLAWTAGPVCVPPADAGCAADPARQSRIEVTTNNQRADGMAQDLATVYAFDRFGNPVSGVAWATSTSDAALGIPVTGGVTGEDGRASVAYTSLVRGRHDARALIAGQEALGSPLTLSFADVPAGRAQLTVAPASQTVGQAIAVTVALTNEAGRPAPGLTVGFASDSAAVTFVDGHTSCTTDAQGRCAVQVTSTQAGSAQIAFAGPPAPTVGGSPASVTFTAGTVDAGLTEVQIVANGARPDGLDRDLVTVVAKDHYGNPVDGVVVTSTTSDPALTIATPIPATGSGGEPGVTQIAYTSTRGGNHRADVLVGGVTPTGGVGSPVTLGFGGQIDPARSSWTIRPQDPAQASPLVVGTTDASSFVATVEARDGLDAPVKDAVVTFTVDPAGPRWADGSYSCLTDASGQCSVGVNSTVSGSYSVQAAAATGPIGAAQPVAWRADAVCGVDCTPGADVAADRYSRVEVTVDGAPADDVTPDVATVYAFDRYGNPVPNQLVTSVGDDPRLRVQDGIPATGDGRGQTVPGVARIEYFTRVAGVEFQATVAVGQPGDLKAPRGLPLRLHFSHDCLPGIDPGCSAVPGQPTSHLEVTADGRPADGTAADTVTAALFDRQGTPVAGLPVRSSTVGPGGVTVAAPAATDASGRAAIAYTTTTAGSYEVTVEVLSQGVWRPVALAAGASPVPPAWQGSPVELFFVGGAPCLGAPGPGVPNEARNHVVVGLNDQKAGVGADRATVWLFDCQGNPSPGAVVRSTSDAAVTVGPIAVTDAAGQTVVTYTTTPAGYGDHLAVVVFADAAGEFHELAVAPRPGSDWPAEYVGSPITLRFVTDSLTPPAVTSPTSGAKLGDPAPTITGTGIPGASVTVADGTSVLATGTVGPDGQWAVTPPPLGDGPHVLTATQTDKGFTSPPSSPITISIGTKPPATCAQAPDDPDCFAFVRPAEGAAVADLRPAFEGVGAPGDRISVVEDGHVLCAATVGADGAWTCQPSGAMPEGAHTVAAVATDAFGNSSDPITRHFGVDVTTTTPVVTRPAEGESVTAGHGLTVTGLAEAGAVVTVRDETGATLCRGTADAQGAWSCAVPPSAGLSEGAHTLVVTSVDRAGNASEPARRRFVITSSLPVTGAPVTRALALAAVVACGFGLGCLLVAGRRRRDGVAAA